MTAPPRILWLYRLLLRAYPADFRRRWGAGMAAAAGLLLARSRSRGVWGPLALWPVLLLDLVRGAAAERRRSRRIRNRLDPSRRRTAMLEGLAHDLRTGLRSLRRAPAFAAAVVATLALGIGANSAIFSVVNAVLLRPLPYPEPERLALLYETNPERSWTEAQVAPANFFDWREAARGFTGLAAFSDWLGQPTLASAGPGGTEPEMLRAMYTSGDLFGVLGVAPRIGRSFREEENWGEAARVVVLSHALWRRRFGGDPAVLGQPIVLNGIAHTVVGVMPEGFRFFIDEVDLWQPFGWEPESRERVWFRRAHVFRVVGRLAPGTALTAGQAELRSIAARLERRYPETNTLMGAGARPLHEFLVGDARRPLALLLLAVGLVLLIACANVAHLQLARSTARTRESAVRGCLGASRLRLVRQGLVESALLAAAGGALGLLVARFATPALLARVPGELPRLSEVSVDGWVLGFTAALAGVTVVLSGLAPALQGARADLESALRSVSRGESRGRTRARDLLVAAEVAVAVVVLAGAALLVRSLERLGRVDPGFHATDVLTAHVSLPSLGYPDVAAVADFGERLLARVRALPGVEDAGLARSLPLTGPGWSSDFAVEGRGREEFGIEVVHREVSPGYLETLRVPLLAGRRFNSTDGPTAPPVVVVNEALARRYFPGEDPVGRRITFDRYPTDTSTWRTIVGVVGAERQTALGQPARPEILAPLAQDDTRGLALVVRGGGPVATLLPELRAALSAVDPEIPLHEVRTLEEVRARSLDRERFLLTLFALFAALSLLLSVLGVYGVTAHAAARRVRDIGVRMALGARAADVVRGMLRRGLAPVALGIVTGLGGALALGRAMASLLYEVGAADPAALLTAAAALLLAGGLAVWLPARRASRLDPACVLRAE
jgi:putative ABC transport system permease protein